MKKVDKQSQALLFSGGTVEDRETGLRMFELLATLFVEPRPIIVFRGLEDSVTEEQRFKVEIHRLQQIKESNGKPIIEATDYETMLYVSTASYAAPLDRVWNRLYLHLFRKVYPDKFKEMFGEAEEYEADISEDLLAQRELKRLKQWIYKRSKTPKRI